MNQFMSRWEEKKNEQKGRFFIYKALFNYRASTIKDLKFQAFLGDKTLLVAWSMIAYIGLNFTIH